MTKQKSRFSFFILVLICLTIAGFLAYRFLPQHFTPDYVPYGLSLNTQLPKGISYQIRSNIQDLSPTEQNTYQDAILYQRTGEYSKAQVLWKELTTSHPRNQHLLQQSILSYLQAFPLSSTQILHATEAIQQAIRFYPDHPTFFYYKGRLQALLFNITEARFALEKAITLSPQYPLPYLELAQVETSAKNWSRAQELLQFSVTLNPESRSHSYAMLAWTLIFQGNLDSADHILSFSETSLGSTPYTYTSRGLWWEYQHLLPQAEHSYQQALNLEKGHPQALKSLASLGQKEFPRAKQTNSKPEVQNHAIALAKRYPTDPDAQAILKLLGISTPKSPTETTEQLSNNDSKPLSATDSTENQPADSLTQLALNMLQQKPTQEKFSWERLGHYKVKWGSTESEFFKKYPRKEFKQLAPRVFYQESPLGLYQQFTTLYFDSLQGLLKIQLLVTDSSQKNTDFLGKVLEINRRVSGVNQNPGVKECPGFKPFQTFLWNRKDNFEMMTQFKGRPFQVRMIRIAPTSLPTPLDLCKIIPELLDFEKR